MSQPAASDGLLEMLEDEDADAPVCESEVAPWKILVVDDDESVHAITRLVLRHVEFRERPLELISVYSGRDARKILQRETDLALAVVDVVMETRQAGLDLVRHIRDELMNHSIRIILRTGQPDQAPEQDIVLAYEVDDYKAKTELTAQKLLTSVIASLRAYAYIAAIMSLNQELEARVAMRTAELTKLAMLDPLTGAGNRRHLNERAAAEIAEYQRHGTPLGVLLFDIDHFKHINDTYGHAVGDHVLRDLVETVKAALRPTDFLARIGGEEFVVLLPGEDAAGAALVAERLRLAIAAMCVFAGQTAVPVTSSFGVTVLHDEANLDLPLERADAALYAAKHGGRNRVVTAALTKPGAASGLAAAPA